MITKAQRKAVFKLWKRDMCRTPYKEFRKRVEYYGDYIGIGWCGMFVGIEKDGYTHT